MRRGPGISALQRHTASNASYATLSSTISAQQITDLQRQLNSFREALLTFSRAHGSDIRRDPALRHQFQKMCAAIGVDPLAAGPRGKEGSGWQDLLGMGDWQVELAVQIVDVCVSTRERNGGMIAMSDLIPRIERLRNGGRDSAGPAGSVASDMKGQITPEDVTRSIKLLKPLGAGYTIVTPDPTRPFETFVRSIPSELETDQAILLSLAASPPTTSSAISSSASHNQIGRLNEKELTGHLGWPTARVRQGLENMVKRDGLAWVDEQVDNGVIGSFGMGVGMGMEVWVPSVMKWEEN